MDSNFRVFWLAPVTRNILGYSLFCKQREKWRAVSRKFQRKKLKKRIFIHLIWQNTKTTIPLRVDEERWIYTSTLRVSVYIHHYSPSLRGIVVYYYYIIIECEFFFQASENQELLKQQPTETIDAAKSMIQLFPRSKFALEFLAKDFLLSLVNAREGSFYCIKHFNLLITIILTKL